MNRPFNHVFNLSLPSMLFRKHRVCSVVPVSVRGVCSSPGDLLTQPDPEHRRARQGGEFDPVLSLLLPIAHYGYWLILSSKNYCIVAFQRSSRFTFSVIFKLKLLQVCQAARLSLKYCMSA